jgi:hypothetical protein
MLEDCFKYNKGCQACQRFGKIQMVPVSVMNPIIKPWPFRGWGMDTIGKINPPSSKGHQFNLPSKDVINFVKEHVIHRFGIPQTITTDGGSVFILEKFKKFTTDTGIKLIRSSPYYAQVNGQAEASNQSLIKLIKRKIDGHPRRWHEVLSEALWALPYYMPWSNKNFSLSLSVRTRGCMTMGNYDRLEAHRVPK